MPKSKVKPGPDRRVRMGFEAWTQPRQGFFDGFDIPSPAIYCWAEILPDKNLSPR
jgi:hypothetical protein